MSSSEINQPGSDKTDKNAKGSNFWKDLGDMTETVIIAIFIILVIFAFIIRPVTVDGDSMNYTFNDKDKVLMTNIFYTPEQGDVVIIDHKESYIYDNSGELTEYDDPLQKRLIKRVIAVGGQTLDIDFETGTVTVDGEILAESYIADPTTRDEDGFVYPVEIPEGYVFVMGDNRLRSTDSRSPRVGLIKEDEIMGKVVCRFYPLNKIKLVE